MVPIYKATINLPMLANFLHHFNGQGIQFDVAINGRLPLGNVLIRAFQMGPAG